MKITLASTDTRGQVCWAPRPPGAQRGRLSGWITHPVVRTVAGKPPPGPEPLPSANTEGASTDDHLPQRPSGPGVELDGGAETHLPTAAMALGGDVGLLSALTPPVGREDGLLLRDAAVGIGTGHLTQGVPDDAVRAEGHGSQHRSMRAIWGWGGNRMGQASPGTPELTALPMGSPRQGTPGRQ